MDETRGQLSLGKTSFTIIATNFVQNLEYLRNLLGIFSCEMLALRVKHKLCMCVAVDAWIILSNSRDVMSRDLGTFWSWILTMLASIMML